MLIYAQRAFGNPFCAMILSCGANFYYLTEKQSIHLIINQIQSL